MIDERSWPTVLTTLLEGDDLSVSQAEWAMSRFMTETPAAPRWAPSWWRCDRRA